MNPPKPTALVEAILLVSPRPINHRTLEAATGLSGDVLGPALEDLAARYAPETSGIVLRAVAGGYQLATNPACSDAIERYRDEARPTPLSSAALEVLSCALYMGPITRGAISATRGVNSDTVVRGLLERGLLKETGADTESPGAPSLLATTEEFLAATGASSHEDFPPLETLVGPEELARVRERLTGATQNPSEPESDTGDN